jgi:hypothetical protein
MENLLSFLSVFFYSALAIIVTVAIIEHRRAGRQSATEPARDKAHQKAA